MVNDRYIDAYNKKGHSCVCDLKGKASLKRDGFNHGPPVIKAMGGLFFVAQPHYQGEKCQQKGPKCK